MELEHEVLVDLGAAVVELEVALGVVLKVGVGVELVPE